MYVFGDKRTGEKNDIYIIHVGRIKIDPFSLLETEITEDEKNKEEYLNGIEVHNTNIREVEATYVRDMIRNEENFLNFQ